MRGLPELQQAVEGPAKQSWLAPYSPSRCTLAPGAAPGAANEAHLGWPIDARGFQGDNCAGILLEQRRHGLQVVGARGERGGGLRTAAGQGQPGAWPAGGHSSSTTVARHIAGGTR